MVFNLHLVSKRLVEVSVDEINTGVMDSKEAAELAKKLINLASELLEVESDEK